MRWVRYGVPGFLILVSVFFFINTLSLPTQALQNPSEPIYFPLIISIGLFIGSVGYLIQEIRKDTEENEDLKQLLSKKVVKILVVVVGLCLLYSLLFEVIGFLFSTILFLGTIFFFLNGKKKWLLNVSVSVLSSLSLWIVFNQLLNVNLP
jgi:putative tricarboxylic transport membrane protein